jgi:hypothetical protein
MIPMQKNSEEARAFLSQVFIAHAGNAEHLLTVLSIAIANRDEDIRRLREMYEALERSRMDQRTQAHRWWGTYRAALPGCVMAMAADMEIRARVHVAAHNLASKIADMAHGPLQDPDVVV